MDLHGLSSIFINFYRFSCVFMRLLRCSLAFRFCSFVFLLVFCFRFVNLMSLSVSCSVSCFLTYTQINREVSLRVEWISSNFLIMNAFLFLVLFLVKFLKGEGIMSPLELTYTLYNIHTYILIISFLD